MKPRRLALFLFLMGAGILPLHAGETLTQFSTIDALMQGIYDGPATIGEVRKAGDFGLGTVNRLDGEMLALNGVFYQITSDGKVHLLPNSTKTPFAAVSFFTPSASTALPSLPDYAALQHWLDRQLGSQNYFWSVRIHGTFTLKVRSIEPQQQPYRPLVEVAKTQSVFYYKNVSGTLIGFRCPSYAKALNVPGYHFHFLSDDRKLGGHVLECSVENASAAWEEQRHFQMFLPGDAAFRHANFSTHDAAGLHKVEQ